MEGERGPPLVPSSAHPKGEKSAEGVPKPMILLLTDPPRADAEAPGWLTGSIIEPGRPGPPPCEDFGEVDLARLWIWYWASNCWLPAPGLPENECSKGFGSWSSLFFGIVHDGVCLIGGSEEARTRLAARSRRMGRDGLRSGFEDDRSNRL